MAQTGSYAIRIRENSSGVNAPGPPLNWRLRTSSARPASRSSWVSPRQTIGVRPLLRAIKVFLATLSSVSRKSWRRSEWPMMTNRQPASASMGAETSPVKAPSLLQETFWPAMATRELFAASKAVEIAVNGGATTMSQCSAFETSGRNEEKNARVSASVLYIFQLPAITRRRICASGKKEKDNAETPRPGRGKRRMQRLRREEGDSFVGEGFDAGEFASAEEFEGGAAAGGDMRNFVGNAGLMDGGYGITATDNGSGAAAGGRGDGFGYLESAFGERGHFEYAHGTIPNDGFGGGNFLAIGVDGFRADIETHTAVGRGGNGNRFRGGVGFELGANDVVDGKEQS